MIDLDRAAEEITPPTYSLSPEKVAQLTANLIDDPRTVEVPTKYQFAAVKVGPNDPESNLARHLERVVFERAFNNDASLMTEAYRPYEPASTFFIVLDRKNRQAAVALRVIQNSPAGFMSLNDVEDEEFGLNKEEVMAAHHMDNLDEVLDIATVAMLPEYRRQAGPVIRGYRAMFVWAQEHGIRHFVSMIDEGPLEKMKQFFGIPFELMHGAKPAPYMGSKMTYPVYGYQPEFIPKMGQHMRTPSGLLAHRALLAMVKGRDDAALVLGDRR
jgi:hypothetical protein